VKHIILIALCEKRFPQSPCVGVCVLQEEAQKKPSNFHVFARTLNYLQQNFIQNVARSAVTVKISEGRPLATSIQAILIRTPVTTLTDAPK